MALYGPPTYSSAGHFWSISYFQMRRPVVTACLMRHIEPLIGLPADANLSQVTIYQSNYFTSLHHNIISFTLELIIHSFWIFYSASSNPLLLTGAYDCNIDAVLELTRRSAIQATMSEGLAQGDYVAARVGFEPATHRTQSTERTTKPPRPTSVSISLDD